jgi:hypothetical protein
MARTIPRSSHELALGSMLTRVSMNTEQQALRPSSRDSPHFDDAFSKPQSVNVRLQNAVRTSYRRQVSEEKIEG